MPTKSTKNLQGRPEPGAESGGKTGRLELTIQRATRARGIPPDEEFRKWIGAALSEDKKDMEIGLRIVNESEGRRLNRDFRHKDYATNVLTFVYGDSPILAGDIVLCASVIKKEAARQCKDLAAHYAHLTVHGILHLQGFDHDIDERAEAMERLETEILAGLGYENPYDETSVSAAGRDDRNSGGDGTCHA
ncbi:MAG TPA: rRNA maturation RNase YbeY [Nitrosospira sp.]|nr:rRNA maturation RNase YbeY [Nitrosospira sp.]